MQIRLSALTIFVDHISAAETVQAQRDGGRMRRVGARKWAKQKSDGGGGLEAAIAPAAIEIEPFTGVRSIMGEPSMVMSTLPPIA